MSTPPCYLADLTDVPADEVHPLIFSPGHLLSDLATTSPFTSIPKNNPAPFTTNPGNGGSTNGNDFLVFDGGSYPMLDHGDGWVVWEDYAHYEREFKLGSVLQWNVTGLKLHVLHQHVNPFQIQETVEFTVAHNNPNPGTGKMIENPDAWFQKGDWHDTLNLPNDCDNFPPKPPTAAVSAGITVKTSCVVPEGRLARHPQLAQRLRQRAALGRPPTDNGGGVGGPYAKVVAVVGDGFAFRHLELPCASGLGYSRRRR